MEENQIQIIFNMYILLTENALEKEFESEEQLKKEYGVEIELIESKYASDNLYEVSGKTENVKNFINTFFL